MTKLMNVANQTTPPVAGGTVLSASDKRYKILETAMKRHQYKPESLIEILHTAQELYGFLENDLLRHIATSLRLPPSSVYGVATFYQYFSLKPKGAHTCVVCMGTACYVKGADQILSTLEQHTKIRAGETTPDNQVSLVTARCIGACGIAPAVVFDGVVTGKVLPENALNIVKGWAKNGSI